MKKTFYIAAAAVAMLGMSACSGTCNNKNCSDSTACNGAFEEDQVYTGVLPGADCDGIRYTLTLDYDDDHNYTDGDYDLVQTYLGADSTAATGYKDLSTFKSKGDFTVVDGQGGNAGKKFLKLVEKGKKSQNATGSTLYFVIDSDSTITMTNSDFETPAPNLNFTLKKAN